MYPINETELAVSIRHLFDHMDFIAVVTNDSGNIKYANQSFLDMVGVDEASAIGMHWINAFAEAGKRDALNKSHSERVLMGSRGSHEVFAIIDRQGEKRIIDWNISVVETETQRRFVVAIGVDITEKVSYETALSSSLQKLSEAQRIAKVGDWEWNIAAGTLEWSEEVYRIFDRDPFLFKPSYEELMAAVHPDDRYELQLMHFRAQETKKSYNADHRIILQSGAIRFVHCETELKLDAAGEVYAMVGTIQDVSELREKELELQRSRELLRRFAQTHDNIREQECKRIAREIHDELGQQLTALRLDIALSANQFGSENPELYKRLQEMKRAVDTTIQTVRSIASSLRPAPLNMGLPSAIDWLVEQLQTRSDLGVELDLKAIPKHLPEEIANSLFRIVQESLTNIARHANAQNVWIIFAKSEDQLILEIRDNGQGFDANLVRQNSSGLLGIVERASLMNGNARIDSRPGEGTKIEVSIPLNLEVS